MVTNFIRNFVGEEGTEERGCTGFTSHPAARGQTPAGLPFPAAAHPPAALSLSVLGTGEENV